MGRTLAAAALAVATWAAIIAPSSPASPCVPADRCCKVCEAGQACGNTCIARNKTCHKGRGCACNASEICSDGP